SGFCSRLGTSSAYPRDHEQLKHRRCHKLDSSQSQKFRYAGDTKILPRQSKLSAKLRDRSNYDLGYQSILIVLQIDEHSSLGDREQIAHHSLKRKGPRL